MNKENSEERKWVCEYCTFENWPAARRCTLCRAGKPPHLITDEVPDLRQQDICQLAPLICEASSSEDLPIQSVTSNKWACQACTYLNWSKSTKCIQCLTQRPKVVPVISKSQNHLSIDVIPGRSMSSERSDNGNHIRNSPSPSSFSRTTKGINNDINRAIASSASSASSSDCQTSGTTSKWPCMACTYENWPRALKCVICKVPKGRSFIEATNSNEQGTIPKDDQNEDGAGRGAVSSDAEDNKMSRAVPGCSTSLAEPKVLVESVSHGEAAATAPFSASLASSNKSEKKDRSEKGQNPKHRDNTHQFFLETRTRSPDWLWLNACRGVVSGDNMAVEAYLAAGLDVQRTLSVEDCEALQRPFTFQPGCTLIHLAVHHQHEDIVPMLLAASDVADAVIKAKKRVPCHAAPDVACSLMREVSSNLRQRKGEFGCYFLATMATFMLPAEIDEFPQPVKERIFADILDEHVQKELEDEEPVINWNPEVTERLGSRLYALWNRTAGDCLLDSVLQATYGIFDRDNTLRRGLAESLVEGAAYFYPRWRESEALVAQSMNYSLDESQWEADWAALVKLASQPGSALEQVHIFGLAHMLRRPIVVYGIKYVKSFRGENLGFARFQGVYLPFLWEPSFCWKSPITLGYTRGHFSALVPMEVEASCSIGGAGANMSQGTEEEGEDAAVFLPMTDFEGHVLPIHFLPLSEHGKEEIILKRWMHCCLTDGGLLVAQQKQMKRPMMVQQMMDEWLYSYRQLAI